MKPLTQQQLDKATENLKRVSSNEILRKIDQLEQNLETLRSDRITIVCLPEFLKVKATRDLLVTILRKRDGRQVPFKAEEPSK